MTVNVNGITGNGRLTETRLGVCDHVLLELFRDILDFYWSIFSPPTMFEGVGTENGAILIRSPPNKCMGTFSFISIGVTVPSGCTISAFKISLSFHGEEAIGGGVAAELSEFCELKMELPELRELKMELT